MSGGLLAGFVGGAARGATEVLDNRIAQRDAAEQLRQRMYMAMDEKLRLADAEDARANRQRTDRVNDINARMDQNIDAELAQRYAEPEMGDTPLTPEQQAVQEQGLKAQRIARERERIEAQRNPKRMLEAAVQTGHADPSTLAQLTSREEIAAAKAEEAAKRAEQAGEIQKTRLQLAEDRAELEREKMDSSKPPSGYRKTEAGDLEAIPGGPADTKRQNEMAADMTQLATSSDSMSRLATAANQLLSHPGLPGIVGIKGKLPNMPGGKAADAQALLETLKSQVGFSVLQAMRDASKTGGALGSVSDAEGRRLEANLAALDRAQSLEQFKASLQQVIQYTEDAKTRMRDAVHARHGGRIGVDSTSPSPTRGAPMVRSPQELAALPSGTVFTAPDGSLRRKP